MKDSEVQHEGSSSKESGPHIVRQLSISYVRATSLIREEKVLSRVLNPELSMQSSRNKGVCAVLCCAVLWGVFINSDCV